ncbi:hypothetical protein DMH04_12105 [Kibdelosporangium aridum]|uniref:Uncharacterized protein n=1 Tax=Kibdelosporangium aridum TaxID=2030 RepID=A0A428ZFV0_KIBAR|nr:hypothetical protein [Kibdelosporangium aridum]RSM86983.1 hypothetical protein DMH04_12105 [Kibdelosporangium aridum]
MGVRHWMRLVGLLLLSLALTLIELLYLPLRFDGALLPMVGGLPFPISAVVAAVTLPWLIKRARRISPRLLVAGSPLWIWLLGVLVAAFPGPGGDVVLIGDWRALLLLGCGALAGSITLGGMLGRQSPPLPR